MVGGEESAGDKEEGREAEREQDEGTHVSKRATQWLTVEGGGCGGVFKRALLFERK